MFFLDFLAHMLYSCRNDTVGASVCRLGARGSADPHRLVDGGGLDRLVFALGGWRDLDARRGDH